MATDEWFRNQTWNEIIASNFEKKLRRARQKEQYLRIQASYLSKTHPRVAHELLDRYFELPDKFDNAQAHVDRATAYLAEHDIARAVEAYEAALRRETEFTNFRTQAYIDLPFLIVSHEIQSLYPRALELLKEHRGRLMFPIDRFKWHAAQAIIADILGNHDLAFREADHALEQATREHSGFKFHPKIGLVEQPLIEMRAKLSRLRRK
jgi:tetratricopeptide (TPR) repeat protein